MESVLKKKKEQRLEGIDWILVVALINYLAPFEKASKLLEGSLYPTLHKVYQCFCMLQRSLTASPFDSAISKYLKQRGMFCLQKKFIIDDIHLLALFLNPKLKALVPLSTSSRVKVHEQAQNLLVAMTSQITHNDDCAQCAVVVDPNSDHEYSNPAKKRRTTTKSNLDDEFEDWLDDSATANDDKILRYIQCSFDQELDLSHFCQDSFLMLLKFGHVLQLNKNFPFLVV